MILNRKTKCVTKESISPQNTESITTKLNIRHELNLPMTVDRSSKL